VRQTTGFARMPDAGRIAIMGPYLPSPPPYASSPAGWGRVEHIEELFADYPVQLSFERRALDFEAESPAAFVDFLADSYGPLLGARNKLSVDGQWEPLRTSSSPSATR